VLAAHRSCPSPDTIGRNEKEQNSQKVREFEKKYPVIWKSFENLGTACPSKGDRWMKRRAVS